MNSRVFDQRHGEGSVPSGIATFDYSEYQKISKRDDARRLLVRLVEEQGFNLAVFLARKFHRKSVINREDLEFLLDTVSLAVEREHPEAHAN